MKMLLALSVLISGCSGGTTQRSSDEHLVNRARQVAEACVRTESCAQRTDRRASGYGVCTGTRLAMARVERISDERISVAFTCNAGEGYIFRVSVNGLTGPAYEEVYQCKVSCPAISEAFAPEA